MNKLIILLAIVSWMHIARSEDVTCSANGKTLRLGERYCVDDTNHKLCDNGGKWFDGQCPAGFKCTPYETDPNQIRCRQYNAVPFPTGPPPGFNDESKPQNGRLLRFRRQNKESDSPVPIGAPSDTCTSNGKTYKVGDRDCKDETTSRVCNWGGEWVEFQCEDGAKCQPLASDPTKVQCFKLSRNSVAYATGPPAGADQP
jgi:hypothetical protein